MRKRLPRTSKAAFERAAAIRRENVQRHRMAAAKNELKDNIARNVANRQMSFELGKLQEAAVRHSGLDAPALARLNQLKTMVR